MRRIPLGRTGIEVPDLCLGTMTFGTTTTEAEGHAQIDASLDHGIDFLDTAEMYPVTPVRAQTHGRTEEIIGTWIAKSGRRADVVVATKHVGEGSPVIKGGSPRIGPDTVRRSVEGSLRRLRTEHVDLYQFHWPNRGSYMFRKNWTYDPAGEARDSIVQEMADCLGALQELVDEGKVRAFGMSNESAWGMARWLDAAKGGAGPRAASVQNEYSLLCRLYDTDLAELGYREDVVLLAFSPLAAGFLTGKYAGGAVPDGSRMSIEARVGGRNTERVGPAVRAYLDIARRHGIDPVHMSLAFCRQRPFPISAIFGARTMEQLEVILDGKDVVLSDEVLADIDKAHRAHPMPF